MKVSLVNLHKI